MHNLIDFGGKTLRRLYDFLSYHLLVDKNVLFIVYVSRKISEKFTQTAVLKSEWEYAKAHQSEVYSVEVLQENLLRNVFSVYNHVHDLHDPGVFWS